MVFSAIYIERKNQDRIFGSLMFCKLLCQFNLLVVYKYLR
jgi:hypothetical protein